MEKSLKKEKNFSKILLKKKNTLYSKLKSNEYDLIINSESNNEISKKFFFQKIKKKYLSNAYVILIKHKNMENNLASKIFTNYGPIAFLPISKNETSIVFSINESIKKNRDQIISLIKKYNRFYKINSFSNIESFNLSFNVSRKYYHKNILCFGENLHKIHPLAGQGFNMILRDIKILLYLIDERNKLGLPINSSVLKEFQENRKPLNFIFAQGIDMIYEFFKFENKYSSEFLKFFLKNKYIDNIASKFADKGLSN